LAAPAAKPPRLRVAPMVPFLEEAVPNHHLSSRHDTVLQITSQAEAVPENFIPPEKHATIAAV